MSQVEGGPTRTDNRALRGIDDQVIDLRTKKTMVVDILQTADEIDNIRAEITYRPNALLDTIPDLLVLIENTTNRFEKVSYIKTLATALTKINNTNKDTNRPVQIKLTRLRKYVQNPTVNQVYREDKLQLLRNQIMEQVNGRYKALSVNVPELLLLDGNRNLDTARTIQNASRIRNLISTDLISKLTKRASKEDFDILSSIYKNTIERFKADIMIESDLIDEEIANLDSQYGEILNSRALIDKSLIKHLPWLVIFVIVILMVPYLYRDYQHLFQVLFVPGLLLRLITVFLLIVTITVLGISSKLDSSALSALIGGISGYVLRDSKKLINDSRKSKKQKRKLMKKAAKKAAEKALKVSNKETS